VQRKRKIRFNRKAPCLLTRRFYCCSVLAREIFQRKSEGISGRGSGRSHQEGPKESSPITPLTRHGTKVPRGFRGGGLGAAPSQTAVGLTVGYLL